MNHNEVLAAFVQLYKSGAQGCEMDCDSAQDIAECISRLTAERDEAVRREKYAITWANRSLDSVKEADDAIIAGLRKALEDLLADYTECTNLILSACDISNWDADRSTGDYFAGLNEAYTTINETINEFIDTEPRRKARAALTPAHSDAQPAESYYDAYRRIRNDLEWDKDNVLAEVVERNDDLRPLAGETHKDYAGRIIATFLAIQATAALPDAEQGGAR